MCAKRRAATRPAPESAATVLRGLIATAVAVALLAAGCSSGGGPDDIGDDSAGRTATPAPEDESESDPPGGRGDGRPGGGDAPDPAQPAEDSTCPVGGGGGGGGSASRISYTADDASPEAGSGPLWQDRPVVWLCFDITEDPSYVQGHQTVRFVPDAEACEVMFRAWPNKPETSRAGNRLDVEGVAVDGTPTTVQVEPAGALPGAPGTLIEVPLPECLAPGEEVMVDIGFLLTLGAGTPERLGYAPADEMVWLGTAFPLLAWQRDHGWVTDPAVDLFGETVTSEVFDLTLLEVVTVEGADVSGTGRYAGVEPGPREGTEVHRFSDPAVRDVAIAAGDFETVAKEVEGVRIQVAAPAGRSGVPLERWLDEHVSAVEELSAHLGEFPYTDLWATIVPDGPSGIEFPGALQYGDVDADRISRLVLHEVAHQWFYGLVGNNQARYPWLDEAFAEYAETLVTWEGRLPPGVTIPAEVRGEVGRSMEWYAELGDPQLYGFGVYRQGGEMLHEARRVVGEDAWEELIRAYLAEHAHGIVEPDDVRETFASEPNVIAILESYGALR